MPLEHYDLYNVNCQTQPMMPAISSQLLLRGGKKGTPLISVQSTRFTAVVVEMVVRK